MTSFMHATILGVALLNIVNAIPTRTEPDSAFGVDVSEKLPKYTAPSCDYSDNALVVDTSSGKFRPLLDPSYPDVAQYLGIPFAAPPLGDLRFAPPSPPPKCSSITNATQYSASCWQFIPPTENAFSIYEPGYDYNGTQDEDCLTLNVASPRSSKSHEPLPVLIFVYGGGFVQGAANITFQKPPSWIQAKQDLIIANIQYRLEVFGFPNAAGLEENNVGLQDIRFAIEWVRDNIAAFGGDPSRMALWGQSAGSVATDMYPYSSYSDPIIKGIIASSGSVFAPPNVISSDFAQTNFTFIAHQLNCTGSSEQLLSCMRAKPASQLNAIAQQYESKTTFVPIPDEKLVFSNYTQQILQGKIANLLDRGTSTAGPNQTQAEEYTVADVVCPAAMESKLRHEVGLNTYRYEYKGNFTNLSPLPWMGACHGAHIPMLLGTSGAVAGHPMNGNSTPFQLSVASHMQDMWRAFTYDPNSLVKLGWPLNGGGSCAENTNAVMLFPGQNNNTLSSIEYGAAEEQTCTELGSK